MMSSKNRWLTTPYQIDEVDAERGLDGSDIGHATLQDQSSAMQPAQQQQQQQLPPPPPPSPRPPPPPLPPQPAQQQQQQQQRDREKLQLQLQLQREQQQQQHHEHLQTINSLLLDLPGATQSPQSSLPPSTQSQQPASFHRSSISSSPHQYDDADRTTMDSHSFDGDMSISELFGLNLPRGPLMNGQSSAAVCSAAAAASRQNHPHHGHGQVQGHGYNHNHNHNHNHNYNHSHSYGHGQNSRQSSGTYGHQQYQYEERRGGLASSIHDTPTSPCSVNTPASPSTPGSLYSNPYSYASRGTIGTHGSSSPSPTPSPTAGRPSFQSYTSAPAAGFPSTYYGRPIRGSPSYSDCGSPTLEYPHSSLGCGKSRSNSPADSETSGVSSLDGSMSDIMNCLSLNSSSHGCYSPSIGSLMSPEMEVCPNSRAAALQRMAVKKLLTSPVCQGHHHRTHSQSSGSGAGGGTCPTGTATATVAVGSAGHQHQHQHQQPQHHHHHHQHQHQQQQQQQQQHQQHQHQQQQQQSRASASAAAAAAAAAAAVIAGHHYGGHGGGGGNGASGFLTSLLNNHEKSCCGNPANSRLMPVNSPGHINISEQHISLDRAARFHRNAAALCDATCTWSGVLPPRTQKPDGYSSKVFLGGVPWDITESILVTTFKQFGQIRVEWPGKEQSAAQPKGYVYVIFESEKQVRDLLDSCTHDFTNGGSWYYKISSKRMKGKEVQVIPWILNDSNYSKSPSQKLNPDKTVFVGALHGMLTAQGLAKIMNDLFDDVIYAGIDTDKYKYPIGSGRVTFSSKRSYRKAVAAAFIEIKTAKFTKKVQVDPYIEDSMCSGCHVQRGPYFCREEICFRYFCRSCWQWTHAMESMQHHNPMTRDSKTNQMVGLTPNISINFGSRVPANFPH